MERRKLISMITIEKLGKNQYGNWCIFTYYNENIIINGIANTKLEKLEENHSYSNLTLSIHSKNGKTHYNILKNEN